MESLGPLESACNAEYSIKHDHSAPGATESHSAPGVEGSGVGQSGIRVERSGVESEQRGVECRIEGVERVEWSRVE